MSFNYVEGTTTVKDIVKALATDFTTATSNKWTLKEPATVGEITNSCILETTTTFNKKFYLKLIRQADNINHILLQIGNKFKEDTKDLEEGKKSTTSKLSWYRETKDLYLGEWLPVQYWLSFSEDFINMILQGDPSPDTEPYENYLISYAYAGAVIGYEGGDEDTDYNFALTTSSDTFLEVDAYPKEFGNRTGIGITDIIMVGTRTGTPYQAHYPSFHTANPCMDKNYIGASNWTHKYHMSEVVVTHAYDRERGKMQNMLVGDRSAIFHLDELIQDKGEPTEKTYKMFNINAPYNFLNNSPNVLYGIALRKS